MSAYYNVILSEPKKGEIKAIFDPHDYSEGAKLAEHAYINSKLCNAVENYLRDNPSDVTWIDDETFDLDEFHKKYRSKIIKNGNTEDLPKNLFVINHVNKQYYNRDNTKFTEYCPQLQINPLPHLTHTGRLTTYGIYWKSSLIEISPEEPKGYKDITNEF